MESLLLVVIAGVALVVLVTQLAPKVGVAAPLLLVLLGIAISFLPAVGPIEIEPELILGVILPPLLYSAAVNIPAMEFRRDLPLISAFSVLLVFASALAVGLLATWLIPDLPLSVGIALGAIVSPTDAVATGIAKKAGLSTRLSTVLEGESLLNDASALVLLRSAIAAVGATLSIWEVGAGFLFAIVVAILIGVLVGRAASWVSARLRLPSLAVAVSLMVPFVAFLPAEHLGASGLVASVFAGLVVGRRAPRSLSPQTRHTSAAVWETVELLLESAIFLLMGLQLFALIEDVVAEHDSVMAAVWLGVLAASAVLAVRVVFVAGSLWLLAARERRGSAARPRVERLHEHLTASIEAPGQLVDARGRPIDERLISRFQATIDRRLSDLDYLASERFGWREGVVLVWAGMRGAITLAAAQSLPVGTPHRSLLILIAFVVAAGTLLLQGSTLAPLATRLGLTDNSSEPEKWERLEADLAGAARERLEDAGLTRPDGSPYSQVAIGYARKAFAEQPVTPARLGVKGEALDLQLDLIRTQRRALLTLRDIGSYPSIMLDEMLQQLDAREISLELRRAD